MMPLLFAWTALAVQEEDPLKDLVPVYRGVEKGLNEFLKGKDAAEAMKPWPAKANEAALDELKKAGVASLEAVGGEYELYFASKGKNVYRVRAWVGVDGESACLVEFRGTAEEYGSGQPLASYVGDAKPFAASAEKLVKALRAKDAAQVRFASDAWFDRVIPPKEAAEGKKEVAKAKEKLAKLLDEVAALEYDEVRLKLDDCVFVGRDSDSAMKGYLKCEWEMDDGVLGFEIGRFRSFK